MTDLFIRYEGVPALTNLTGIYTALEQQVAAVRPLVAELRTRRGERLEDNHPNQALVGERMRAYDVAHIRLELAIDGMFAKIRELHAQVAILEANLGNLGNHGLHIESLAKNNVLCARELADSATELYYEVVQKEFRSVRCSGYFFGIMRAFRDAPASTDPREFVVMYSGHGSAYRFENEPGDTPPPPPYQTLAEAKRDAVDWEGSACTIGGGAQIYNVRTKQIVPLR